VAEQILQSWGKTLQNYFSSTEILGYWGDGEFCIAMPFISRVESLERMESLTLELRTKVFTSASGDRFCVSYNYSMVEYPHDGLTIQSL
jgi:GGDEF domain-containing protein